ncbi:MAG: FadR family transcriptional regulator [Polyangiaceae bacterium]|nr:FadR family transcriptional regulator [Polyangiaceae bacterium]
MTTSFRLNEVPRRSAADVAFEQLAGGILRGDLAVGEPLPSERELAQQLGVSRIIVRQATHRLAELGLVRVRQGGATLVLDPDAATDTRVIGLYYTLDVGAEARRGFDRDVLEKQFLQGLALTSIAERRASPQDLAALARLAADFDDASASDADFRAFEARFWADCARAGGNRILRMEVSWWYQTLEHAPREPLTSQAPMAARIGFYRELGNRLASRAGAAAYYLEVVSPILSLLFASEEPAK